MNVVVVVAYFFYFCLHSFDLLQTESILRIYFDKIHITTILDAPNEFLIDLV